MISFLDGDSSVLTTWVVASTYKHTGICRVVSSDSPGENIHVKWPLEMCSSLNVFAGLYERTRENKIKQVFSPIEWIDACGVAQANMLLDADQSVKLSELAMVLERSAPKVNIKSRAALADKAGTSEADEPLYIEDMTDDAVDVYAHEYSESSHAEEELDSIKLQEAIAKLTSSAGTSGDVSSFTHALVDDGILDSEFDFSGLPPIEGLARSWAGCFAVLASCSQGGMHNLNGQG